MTFPSISDLYDRAEEQRIPLAAKLDVTFRCNLRCVHCYIRPSGRKEMNTREVLAAIDQLAGAGSLFLSVSGGEPLVRKDFFDIAYYARKRGFALTIFTNATLVTKESARWIAGLYPQSVRVTLYGASEDTYAKVTGQASAFQRAVEGIRYLRGRRLPVSLTAMIFNSYTPKEILWMKRFSRSVGADFSMSPIFLVAMNGDLTPLKNSMTREQIEIFYKKFPEIRREKDARNRTERRVCETLRYQVYVNPYGDVGNCYRSVGRNNILSTSFLSRWKNDPFFQELRELRFSEMKKCQACKSLAYCYPCPGTHFLRTGKFTEPWTESCDVVHLMRECSESLCMSGPGGRNIS